MRSAIRVWAVVGLLVILHFGLHLSLALGKSAPDLLTLALLIAAREAGVGAAAGLGFLFGLLDDAFSVVAFGANTFALTVTGVLGSKARDLFVGDSPVFTTFYLFLGKWCRDFLYWVAHWVAAGESMGEPFVDAMLINSPLAAVYAALIGLTVVFVAGLEWETVR